MTGMDRKRGATALGRVRYLFATSAAVAVIAATTGSASAAFQSVFEDLLFTYTSSDPINSDVKSGINLNIKYDDDNAVAEFVFSNDILSTGTDAGIMRVYLADNLTIDGTSPIVTRDSNFASSATPDFPASVSNWSGTAASADADAPVGRNTIDRGGEAVGLQVGYTGGGLTDFQSEIQGLLNSGTPFAAIHVRDCDGDDASCQGFASHDNGTSIPVPATFALLGAGLIGLGLLSRRRVAT